MGGYSVLAVRFACEARQMRVSRARNPVKTPGGPPIVSNFEDVFLFRRDDGVDVLHALGRELLDLLLRAICLVPADVPVVVEGVDQLERVAAVLARADLALLA